MFIAPWHFSFTVSDLERSVHFYCDILGLELVHRQEQANPYTRQLVGYPDAYLRVAQLRIRGAPPARSGHLIELVEYVAPRGQKVDTRTFNPGTAHLAFEVDDLEAALEGKQILAPVSSPSEGVRVAMILDNGAPVELLEFRSDLRSSVKRPPA